MSPIQRRSQFGRYRRGGQEVTGRLSSWKWERKMAAPTPMPIVIATNGFGLQISDGTYNSGNPMKSTRCKKYKRRQHDRFVFVFCHLSRSLRYPDRHRVIPHLHEHLLHVGQP
jgi:hypothetical protein